MSRKFSRKFIDSIRIYVKGGKGGIGLAKYGGMGGKGGDVYAKAVIDQTIEMTRSQRRDKRWIGEPGVASMKYCILGQPANNLFVPVPPGTTILSDHNEVLGELNEVSEVFLIATGGAGGHFHNNNYGQEGKIMHVKLELKIIADIGLVGFPNAGKSTFLRAVSRATPKIASYPFTTMSPNIGEIVYSDLRKIKVADLPGLIEGAWLNQGMGHNFLKHVERTKIMLFVVDVNGFQLRHDYAFRTATENIVLLNRELELYRSDLLDKPCVLLINKMDTPDAMEKLKIILSNLKNLKDVIQGYPVEMRPDKLIKFEEIIPCSARSNMKSMDYVMERLRVYTELYTKWETEE